MAKQEFDHSDFIQGIIRQFGSIGFDAPSILEEGPRSLKIAQAVHVEHSQGERGVTLHIHHYSKRENRGPFLESPSKVSLKEDGLKKLCDYLRKQEILKEVNLGEFFSLVVHKSPGKSFSPNQKAELGKLIEALCSENELGSLLEQGILSSDALRNIHVAFQHLRYKNALADLKVLLETEHKEQSYQNWFKNHPWVFGITYSEMVDIRRIGLHEISDIILKTVDGYFDLFELKQPVFEVLNWDAGRKVYFLSKEASLAVSQCAKYMRVVEDNRLLLTVSEDLPLLKPRARIIIGRSQGWDKAKQNALREINASLHYIEILTYDHVVAMAQQFIGLFEKRMGPKPVVSREEK